MLLLFTKHLFYIFFLDAYSIAVTYSWVLMSFFLNINVDITEIKTQAKQSLFLNVVLKQQHNNLYTVDGLRP